MHNLEFYRTFMADLRRAMMSDRAEVFLGRYAFDKQAALLMNTIKGGA